MPIYEYECKSCENVFEVQQRMTDEPLKTCPECKGELKKLISASSFKLKGGGWYADGYSGPSNGKNGSSSKNQTTSTSSCQKSGAEGCKNCPAASA